MDPIALLVSVIVLAISIAVMFWVVQKAVITAMREARREEWFELYAPEQASWASESHRRFLRAMADEQGRKPPTVRG